MNEKIQFAVNHSSVANIVAHFFSADAAFVPALSSRIEVNAYAQKLHDRAVRFEAWLGEELVGMVANYCNQPNGGKSFITSVSVLPEFQGLGIATSLMRQCMDHARGLGFWQIELQVDQRSLPAVALYQKLGFKILARSGSTFTMGTILPSASR